MKKKKVGAGHGPVGCTKGSALDCHREILLWANVNIWKYVVAGTSGIHCRE
jgi:hypothetical protein